MSPSRRHLFGLTLGLAALPGFSVFAKASTGMTAHDFSFTSIDGAALPLKQFKGKTLLVVNTASQCGFTKQYTDLQSLWSRYRDKGLVVLGVPSNDFGGQEPGSSAEIKNFCEVNFDVDFPLTEKEVVVGDKAHPFYKWAAAEFGELAKPRWNFHKYLIDGNGKPVDWYATTTNPMADKVIAAVETTLAKA
ncbi:glutathione peroxidase [Ferrovibrio sp.]|uniref:glutathione peroxidase n=1 Tax=Ferrovibrio sp. TaxID=1917215 RepID=UPI0025BAE739|nr:glutathione peroxidase [Ferrovibrio sp.]MBX3455713.1 glutathione peroxidase [Ferrovibrio sp.]